ncbi:ABC transporter permease [Panacibacter sp. DH6]|uniref:ABC transporter permease n=1 Tax=Panacibacter microcysteis TaxID=2793269 RepID=A0A931E9D9_9BACT|nr:ABC transporter permease [Panacibacter microcysteis]MBG9377569.1 ABC transporter permease [Panacibacter microcysteis]
MIKNYLKIAWRSLSKNKVFSLINILGLTIGITVCMMIFVFIMNEFSFDNFHAKKDNLYRVARSFDQDKTIAPWVSGPYASALKNDFPAEIKNAVRIMPSSDLIVIGDKSFNEKNVYLADDNFFSVFSFPLLRGNVATALKEPGSIVLTETTAKKYFGSAENAMSKVLQMDKDMQLKVTAVAKDVPSNSHLSFDMVVPLSNWYNEPWFKVWINNNHFVYLELNDHVDKAKLEQKFPAFMDKYMGTDMKRMGVKVGLKLTPVKEIYFSESSSFDPTKHGDKTIVYIFLSIAVLILLIACINFMNLSTIRAVERSKEVGLRKVLGALRNQLVLQFIGESFLLTIISCIFSLVLLQLLSPLYNQLLGYTLTVSWNTWPIYVFLTGIILVVGFLAGSYPAFVLSAFKPVESLKGKLKLGKGGSTFRQALVVVQFSISVLLIVGTIVIVNQMSYVKNKQLGYDREQTLAIPIDNEDFYEHLQSFKSELLNNSNIESVSMMSGEPGGFFDQHTFEVEGQRDTWKARTEFADFDIVNTLGLKVIAGRSFSPQFGTDSTDAVMINHTAATKLGFTPAEAVGKWIKNTIRDTARRRIVGVVEDFNFLSLKENMEPLVISTAEDRRVALVKIKPGHINAGTEAVKKAYATVTPLYPLEYTFLDQKFDSMYRTDIRQQTILGIFSGLAIFIACLGLFGLASFTTAKRTKEIGVRKVLGSSTQNIVVLLSKDLLKPVMIATVIAMPVGYYAMNTWLQNFAYRTPFSWWIFVLAAVIIFGIALLTVSIKALKAAIMNPAKSLRSE